ncbi:MAG: hypothetical protein AAFP86_03820 [Planctomycetota bacterium]
MLSAPEVVAASRAFVCVRPQTYESEAEAKILSYVFSGRSGLENTSFALLDPAGKKISRGGRSATMAFGSTERFTEALEETAARYAPKAKAIEALPTLRDLRLALNVAAADMRPLVVVRGKGAAETKRLTAAVAELAWGDELVGTSHYVVLVRETEVSGLTPERGISVVQPDPYGLGGEVLFHAPPTTEAKALAKGLAETVGAYEVEAREHDAHVREARRRGITWESEIPVTDSRANGEDDERPRRRRR